MYYSAYGIRRASERDAEELRHLAALDSQRPVKGRVLVAERRGEILAALSVDEGHAITDPSQPTGSLVAALRARAHGMHAHERTPSLRARLLAAIPHRQRSHSHAAA
jgi:hypothetical protein